MLRLHVALHHPNNAHHQRLEPLRPLFLTPTQINAAKALDAALDQPNVQLFELIHSLSFALMSTSRSEVAGNQFLCPQIVHLIFSNLHPDGVFETPEAIGKCIAKFSWVIRATAVYEASKHKDEYAEGMLG